MCRPRLVVLLVIGALTVFTAPPSAALATPGDPASTVAGPAEATPAPDPTAGAPVDEGAGTDPASAPAPSDPTNPPSAVSPQVPPAVPIVPIINPRPRKPPRHAIRVDPILSGPTVAGTVGKILPSGRAAAPSRAPHAVKVLIWTANRLIGLRYRWGGGHSGFADRAYDCSGAISYALHAAGMLASPRVSGELAHWGRRGIGRWITVYANARHVFMLVAGLRLDTSPAADPTGLLGPRWRPAPRPTRTFHPRRPG